MNINTFSKSDNQRTAVTLNAGPDFSMEVRYEPIQHSLRVIHAGVQRLFFYEPDGFFPSRASLLNEYGLVIGKIQMRSGSKGILQVHDARFSFQCDVAAKTVTMEHPAYSEPLTWHYGPLHDSGAMQVPDLFRSLVVLLGWSVAVPSLQA